MKFKVTPRDYQENIVNQTMAELNSSSKPVIVQASCSAGKSLMIAMTADRLQGKTLILQPNVELLRQNTEKMSIYTDDIGIYSASAGSKTHGNITMGTIGSVVNGDFSDYTNLLIDECDAGFDISKTGSQFVKFVNKNNFKRVVGYTATPYRLKSRLDRLTMTATQQIVMLNRIPTKGRGKNKYGTFFWGKIVGKIESRELLSRGYISQVEYMAEKQGASKVLKVNKSSSEYTKESLEEYASLVEKRVLEISSKLIENNIHDNLLVFVSSVESCENVARVLNNMGIKAGYVVSSTPKKERKKVVEDFKAGKIKVLVNCSVMLAGFDYPELQAVLNAKATLSVRTYIQMVGRVQRKTDTKDRAMFYDISGTALMFGKAEGIRLGKEDGWKDCLMYYKGRLDNRVLGSFSLADKMSKSKLKLSKNKGEKNE